AHTFMAAVTPPFSGSAMSCTSGQRSRSHCTVSSREPSSTTTTSKSRKRWRASDGSTTSSSSRPLYVGIATVTAGTSAPACLGNDGPMEAGKVPPGGRLSRARAASSESASQAGLEPPEDRRAGSGLVDVVVVSAGMAQVTLDCVRDLDDPLVAKIIVVDNAFDARAGASRGALASQVTVLPLGHPHGFAAANNRGLEVGDAPYVLLLNSDILVVAGAIERLLE